MVNSDEFLDRGGQTGIAPPLYLEGAFLNPEVHR